MSLESSPYYPEDFFVRENDFQIVQAKIGVIAMGGADLLEARLDFDRTMTTNGPKDLTSWDVLSRLLPEEGQRKDNELWAKYQPLELDHKLTRPQAEKWWNGTLQLYADYGVDLASIEGASEDVLLRPGTPEFFNICKLHDIHTTVLSAGVKNVIDVVANRYGIDPTLVLSTELKEDPETQKITWDKDRVIHILNKGERGNPQLQEIRRDRPNTIVIGDALEDTSMAEDHEDGTVLRIRVGDPHKIPPHKVSEYLEESFLAGYDLVRLGDFHPINNLAAFIIDAANRPKPAV
jgi:HAD superfamily phosphoserine phosphatase-like hydrolase